MGSVVAVVAFDDRRYMKFRFSDGRYTVVAFAAIPKYFPVIQIVDSGKPDRLRCMTGHARVTGSKVIE